MMPIPDTRTPHVARQQREQSQRRSDRVDPRHDYRMPIVEPTPLVIWSEDWPVVLVLAVVAIVVAGLGLFGAHGLGWI